MDFIVRWTRRIELLSGCRVGEDLKVWSGSSVAKSRCLKRRLCDEELYSRKCKSEGREGRDDVVTVEDETERSTSNDRVQIVIASHRSSS